MFGKYFLVTAAHFIGTAYALKLLIYILPKIISSYYYSIANILLFSIISWHALTITKKNFLKDRIRPENKAVLITGCDSGFGHNLAKRLDSKGFTVFATCMFPTEAGANNLRKSCSSRLQILKVDVTEEESVQNAVKFVEQHLGSLELWAVVNNAGIGKGLSVAMTGIQEFQDCLDVNVLGAIRVTKAFLPLLKRPKGRVVNITSIFGRVIMPHSAPYVVSKYAAVGFSDVLRQELVDWGVSVISVEPELFKTGLTDLGYAKENLNSTYANRSENIKNIYDEEFKKNFERSQNIFLKLASPNIQVVINDLESAVSLKYPDRVYNPRRNLFMRFILFVYVVSPIPFRDFFAWITLHLLRYKKPVNIL